MSPRTLHEPNSSDEPRIGSGVSPSETRAAASQFICRSGPMNPMRDDLPEIPCCPHCGHKGKGLQYAFPDSLNPFARVQVACLKCGAHGPEMASYTAAVEAFKAGELEVVG